MHIPQNFKNVFVAVAFSALFLSACSAFRAPVAKPSPAVTSRVISIPAPTKPSTAEIRSLIDTGMQARESGDYQTGEQKLTSAFADASELGNSALGVEAGNNLSIQFRLSAGRANRKNDPAIAQSYSQKSLAVYQQLKDLGWFNASDPATIRSWAHALLYAGKVTDAIPLLQQSLSLQKDPAAQGDENDHLAAAHFAQGDVVLAQIYSNKGLKLLQQQNTASKVWVTFGLMMKATVLSQQHHFAESQAALNQALTIAKQNNLAVRQEEITYLLSLPQDKVNVVKAVMTMPGM